MNKVNVFFQGSRNRIGKGPNGLASSFGMREDRVLRVEHLVRFANGNAEAEPVACRRYRRSVNAVFRKPLRNSGDCIVGWFDEIFDLQSMLLSLNTQMKH